MSDKLFANDANTKRSLSEIAALFGVPFDLVRSVWEYTIITYFIKLSESPEKLQTLTIPYIGNLGIRFKGETLSQSTGKYEADMDVFFSMSEAFKEMVADVCLGESDFPKYVENHRMKDLTRLIGSSDAPLRNSPKKTTTLAPAAEVVMSE